MPSGHRFSASLSRSFLRPQSSVFLCSSVNHKTERTLNHPNTHPKGNSPSNNLLDVVIANNTYMAEARGAACYHQTVLATKASWAQLGKILHLLESSAIPPPPPSIFFPRMSMLTTIKKKVILKLSGIIKCKQETERDTWIWTKIPKISWNFTFIWPHLHVQEPALRSHAGRRRHSPHSVPQRASCWYPALSSCSLLIGGPLIFS